MSSQQFRDCIRVFTTTDNPISHAEAIIQMLDPLDLDIEYKKLAHEGGLKRVLDIFRSFSDVSDELLLTEYESTRLRQVGVLTEEYFGRADYLAFSVMVYQLLLESFLEKYDFQTEDISGITPAQLYKTIPEEIQLQTFLIESMADSKIFDWNRSQSIIIQSLLVLTVCFSDVYSFLTDDEVDENEFTD
jgi:hypothetical protein